MCGITGYFTPAKRDPMPETLEASVHLMTHRGPDDFGTWEAPGAGLGMRRLAIQDLSAKGHQPMISPDGRYILVFNGEIYNFKILRKELEAEGCAFDSGTDTEVLLTLFAREGKACLSKLNGMFAFAVYDTREEVLFLARDRFGIKPLYLLRDSQGVFFSSEYKTFLPFVRSLGMPWELDDDRIYEYMLFRFTAGEHTLIRNVTRVPPGSWVELRRGGGEMRGVFYEFTKRDVIPCSEEEAVERLKAGLMESIRLRLISDAPLGVALSGGVDSSLITALLREMHGGPIETFSVVFDEKEQDGRVIDESPYSDYIAERYETNHHRLRLDQERFTADYLKSVWHHDEPLNFPNSLGIYLFSKTAAESVKVLLGGEGADETFGGYAFFTRPGTLTPFKHQSAQPEGIDELLRTDRRSLDARDGFLSACAFEGVKEELFYTHKTYLQSVELRLDKMSMATALEARVPFLDHHVVETAFSLPDSLLVDGDVGKSVVKKLAERYMPREQIYREKIGLSTPLNQWLREEKHLGQYLPVLEEARTLERPFLKADGVRDLLKRFRSEPDTFKNSMGGRIWILLNLEMWIRTFIEDKQPL